MGGPAGADPTSEGMWKALPWACWVNESLWDWEGESIPTRWAAARLDVTWSEAVSGEEEEEKERIDANIDGWGREGKKEGSTKERGGGG